MISYNHVQNELMNTYLPLQLVSLFINYTYAFYKIMELKKSF